MKIKPIVIALLALAVAYAAYWYAIAHYAEGYVATRLAQLQKSGVTLSYDSFATGGFPYRLQLLLENARLDMQDGPYRLVATTDELEIDVKPWQWSNATFVAQGVDIELRSNWAPWVGFKATVASLQASYSENGEGSSRHQFDLQDIYFPSSGMRIKSASMGARNIGPPNMSAANELYEPNLARFSFDFDGIDLPQTEASSGGGYLDELAATIEIHGDSLPQLDVGALENWRDSGGTVELTNFSFRAGESVVVGEGSFSLDEHLRVIGASSLIISKVEKFRLALRAIGTDWAEVISRSTAAEMRDDDQQVLSIMLANGTATSGAQIFYRFGAIIRPD